MRHSSLTTFFLVTSVGLARAAGCGDDDDSAAPVLDAGVENDATPSDGFDATPNDTVDAAFDASDAKAPVDASPPDGSVPDGSTAGSGDYKATKINMPAGETTGTGIALSNAGHVLVISVSGAEGLTFDHISVWKDGASALIPIPADKRLSSNVGGCVNSSGHAAFNAQPKAGGATVLFWNGSTITDVGVNNAYVTGCSDADEVIMMNPGVGGKSFTWQPGAASPTELQGAVTISPSGTTLLNNGTRKDGTFTALPSAILGMATKADIGGDNVIVGTLFAGGVLSAAKADLGAGTVAALPSPPGLAAGKSTSATFTNSAGDTIVLTDDTAFVHVPSKGGYKVPLEPGWKNTKKNKPTHINDSGWLLTALVPPGDTANVAVVLKPNF